jgi:hypothetical protein
MGFHPGNITHSQKLAQLVLADEDAAGECCDLTSTAGYDNDGSIGPELVDNGIGLAFEARGYDANATIFFAFGDNRDGWVTCYYQYGTDEDDAARRLRERLAE